jgi:hypothetical protein
VARALRQRRAGRPGIASCRRARGGSAGYLVGEAAEEGRARGDLDQLRARAFLDIMLGRDSRAGGSGSHSPEAPPTASIIPAGFAGRINLTIPLAALLGLAERPGEISGLGPIDPDPGANT